MNSVCYYFYFGIYVKISYTHGYFFPLVLHVRIIVGWIEYLFPFFLPTILTPGWVTYKECWWSWLKTIHRGTLWILISIFAIACFFLSILGDSYKLLNLVKSKVLDIGKLQTMSKEALHDVARNCGIKISNKYAVRFHSCW